MLSYKSAIIKFTMVRSTYRENSDWVLQAAVFLVTEVVVVVSCDGRMLHALSDLSETNFST
jgi:hypothetical protein